MKWFIRTCVVFTAGMVSLWWFVMLTSTGVPYERTWPLLIMVNVCQFLLGSLWRGYDGK